MNIQCLQYPHLEVVKGNPYKQVNKEASMDKKEVYLGTPLTVAYIFIPFTNSKIHNIVINVINVYVCLSSQIFQVMPPWERCGILIDLMRNLVVT